jgi:hypothetical protein
VRLVRLKIAVSIEKKMRFRLTWPYKCFLSETIIEEFQIEVSPIPKNVTRQAIVVWWLRQKSTTKRLAFQILKLIFHANLSSVVKSGTKEVPKNLELLHVLYVVLQL